MNNKEYKCDICVKTYLNYKSLWNHNKFFHNKLKNEVVETNTVICFSCLNCGKKYKHKQSLYKHEKTCTYIQVQPSIDKEIELEVEKQETLKLQIKLQKMKKIDTKTFKSVNKLLMDRSTTINNNNNSINNSNNNTQNIINLNFPNILSFGKENIPQILTHFEKKLILDSLHMSLDKMIDIVHCGNHNTFKNIIITNLKDRFAYKYDDTKGYFVAGDKIELLNELFTWRIMDLENIYEELASADRIDSKTKRIIQDFLNKMENEEPVSEDGVEYKNYKSYRMHNIKILLYNNRDKLTNDIALLIGDEKTDA